MPDAIGCAEPFRPGTARRPDATEAIARSVDRDVLDGEALGLKGVDEPADLPGIARLAFDVDRRVLGRQMGEDALMVDLDDVDLVVREQLDPGV